MPNNASKAFLIEDAVQECSGLRLRVRFLNKTDYEWVSVDDLDVPRQQIEQFLERENIKVQGRFESDNS